MDARLRILVMGEATRQREALGVLLANAGYEVVYTESSGEALRSAQSRPFAVALIDTFQSASPPPLLTHSIRKASPTTEVIIMVGHSSHRPTALSAIGNGAFTYVMRGPDNHQLLLAIRRAVERRQLLMDMEEMRRRLALLFEQLPVGILIVDVASRIVVDANRYALEVMGASKEEVAGKVCLWAPAEGRREGGPLPLASEGDSAFRIPATMPMADLEIDGRPHRIEAFVDSSGHRAAEAELRQYRALCDALVDDGGDVRVVSLGRDGRVVAVIRPGVAFAVPVVEGMEAAALVPPDERVRMLGALQRTLDVGWAGELALAGEGGAALGLRLVPVPGPAGVSGALLMLRDETARRRAETRLPLRDEMVNHLEEAVIAINERGEVADANPALCAWLGVSASELIGRSYYDIDKFVPCTTWADQLRALGEQAQVEYESRLYGRDGTRHRVRIVLRLVVVARARFVIGAYTWLARGEQQEAAVHRLQNMERGLMAAASDAVMILDREGRILRMNAAAGTLDAAGAGRAPGASYYEALPMAIAKDRRRRIEDALLLGQAMRFEDQVEGRIQEHVLQPVEDHTGALTHVILRSSDVTEARERVRRLRVEREQGPAGVWVCDVAAVSAWAAQAERALREDPAAYCSQHPGAVDLCLDRLRVCDTTPALLDLLGVADSEVLRVTPARLLTGGDRRRFVALLLQVLFSGNAGALELRLETPAGGQVHVQARLALSPADTGGGMLTIWVQDLGPLRAVREEVLRMSGLERRRMGEALTESLLPLLRQISAQAGSGGGEALTALADQAREQTELLARGLRREDLLSSSLVVALQHLARDLTIRHGIQCRCNLGTPGVLQDPVLSAHLLQIAQEGADLAIRRRHAGTVTISLVTGRHSGRLVLRDAGGRDFGEGDEREDPAWILIRQHADLIQATIETEQDQQGRALICLFTF